MKNFYLLLSPQDSGTGLVQGNVDELYAKFHVQSQLVTIAPIFLSVEVPKGNSLHVVPNSHTECTRFRLRHTVVKAFT